MDKGSRSADSDDLHGFDGRPTFFGRLVTGSEKMPAYDAGIRDSDDRVGRVVTLERTMVRRLQAAEQSIPVGRARRNDSLMLADNAAVGERISERKIG